MSETVNLKAMFSASRSRVYLLWALICASGFIGTHFYQNPNILFVWLALAILGLWYMLKVMPMRMPQMRQIYQSWLIPIVIGMVWSVLAVKTTIVPQLVVFLGAFWLIVIAAGLVWNGTVDRPALWYYLMAVITFIAGMIIYLNDSLLSIQYLIAAIVTTWAMLMLWVFRADSKVVILVGNDS